MVTTIAVKESTAQYLAKVKEKLGAASFDETIVKVLQKTENMPSSRFGSQPKMKKFSEKDRARFHEL